jgi:hypothetical protein
MTLLRMTWLLSAGLLLLTVAPAAAQTRQPPEATQHALDELANAIAQGKITRTPTPTPTAIATVRVATDTPLPTAVPPTDTPRPTPTPAEPALPVPGGGYAAAGYLRPLAREPDGPRLELALAGGRWAVLYDTSVCAALPVWSNVWLAQDEASERPITVSRDDDTSVCVLAKWAWISDAPCAADDDGTCNVALEQDMPVAAPTAARTATVQPQTPLPTATATLEPVVAPEAEPEAGPPAAEVVVETLVVEVTPVPIAMPTATVMRLVLPTVTRVPTAVPTPTRLPTLAPTATEVPVLMAEISAPTPPSAPAPMPPKHDEAPPPAPWNWPLTFVLLAAALAAAAIWLLVARSGPMMW